MESAEDIFPKTGGHGLVFPACTFLLLISTFVLLAYKALVGREKKQL